MSETDLFHAVLVGGFFALGIGAEHLRIRWAMKRKQMKRRQSFGMAYRKDPEPVWAKWSAEIGRGLRR